MKTKQNRAVTASAAEVSLADELADLPTLDPRELVPVFVGKIREFLDNPDQGWYVFGEHHTVRTKVINGWISSESLITKESDSQFPRYYLLRLSLREIPA